MFSLSMSKSIQKSPSFRFGKQNTIFQALHIKYKCYTLDYKSSHMPYQKTLELHPLEIFSNSRLNIQYFSMLHEQCKEFHYISMLHITLNYIILGHTFLSPNNVCTKTPQTQPVCILYINL